MMFGLAKNHFYRGCVQVHFLAKFKHTIVLLLLYLSNGHCRFRIAPLIYIDGQLIFAIPSKTIFLSKTFAHMP